MKTNNDTTETLSGARGFLYKIIYPGGLISTAVLFLMALLAEYTNVDADYKPALTLRSVAIVISFSFFFALANRILYSKDLAYIAKLALHCLAVTADFVVICIFFGGYYKYSSSALSVSVIFVVIYIAVAALASIIRYAVSRHRISKSNYKRQF